MFEPEKEVPKLELCKKLKELGYPQDGGGWYWREEENRSFLGIFVDKSDLGWTLVEYIDGIWMKSPYLEGERLKNLIKAPTVRELGEWVEVGWHKLPTGTKTKCCFPYSPSEINPNILAKDLLWLIENGYVKFDKEVR